MYGGTLTANSLAIGSSSGASTFYQAGGIVNSLTNAVQLGYSGSVGTYLLNGGALNTLSISSGGLVVQAGSSFIQTGGTYNGYLLNAGNFNYSGGSFNGTLENAINGNVALSASFIAGAGVLNKGAITLGLGVSLGSGLNGLAAVDNENTITLAGGGFTGLAAVINNGGVFGYGTFASSLGLINNGTLIQGAGNLVFSTSSSNNASVTLLAGRQLQLTQGSFTNNASFILNSALVSGAGTLNNAVGGAVYGPGTISSVFQNTGNVEPNAGTLNIINAWTNAGYVVLNGTTSSLSGGTLTNNSQIQGVGSVGNAINNAGLIEASGGTLALNGVVNNPTGTLAAATDTKLVVTQGLATNAGLISLVGGTFDNNSHPLNNTGQITGFGIIRTGGLTNNGIFNLTGSNPAAGTTTVNGNVTNSVGKLINVEYNPAIFTGNIVNNGTIKSTGTTVTFAGTYTGNNYISDPSTNIFQNNVTINAGGSMTGGVGDVYRFIGGTVVNNGTFTNAGTLNSYVNFANNLSFTQAGPQAWTPGTIFTNSVGTAFFGSDAGAGGQNLTLNASSGLITLSTTQHLLSIGIAAAGKVQIIGGGNGNRSIVYTTAFSNTGVLNIGANDLDVQAGGPAALAALTLQIKQGSSNGTWTGQGINSSVASNDSAHLTAAGVIINTISGSTPLYTNLDGGAVAVNDVLVKYTYYGDCNLDGKVDGTDYARIDNGFLAGGTATGWFNGDFNYDSAINGSDYTLIDNAFNQQGVRLSAQIASATAQSGTTAVPEPASMAVLSLTALSTLVRRRKQ